MNNISYCIHSFFIHSLKDRHLGCSHVLSIINNAAMKLESRYFFKIVISFSSDIHLEVELLDHMVVLFLIS